MEAPQPNLTSDMNKTEVKGLVAQYQAARNERLKLDNESKKLKVKEDSILDQLIAAKVVSGQYGPYLVEAQFKDVARVTDWTTFHAYILESGSIDYIFLYRSVAIQHHLNFLELPDQINLKNPAFATVYATASTEINGSEPGKKETVKGEPMVYGLTILRNAPNKQNAIAFLDYLLSKYKGMAIMAKNGQPSLVPMPCPEYDKIPEPLRKYATKP